MAILSGKYAAIDGVSTTTQWTATDSSTPAEARTSNTQSGTSRVPGTKDWIGSLNGMGEFPPLMPTQRSNVILYTAPDDGIRGNTGWTLQGGLIVEGITMNWDWQANSMLNYTVDFASGAGAGLTRVSAAIVDNSTPLFYSMCPLKIEWSVDDATWYEWTNLVSATLNITANNPSTVNSSTDCNTAREPGIVDWTLAVVEQTTKNVVYPVPPAGKTSDHWETGEDIALKLYTTPTKFWYLKWANIVDFSDLTADNDTGDIIGQTVNFAMNGNDRDAGIGTITLPNTVEYWPCQVISDFTGVC